MNFHGGYFGKDKLVDFSVNIPPIPYDDSYRKMLIDHINTLQKYPELSGEETKRALSKRLGYKSEALILGNGATELIYLFARTQEVKKALILEPTFTEYKRALKTYQVEILRHDLDLSAPQNLDTEKIINRINAEAIDLLVICNPNNPTGHLYKIEDLQRILEGVRTSGFKLFIDESFIDFVSVDYQKTYDVAMKRLMDQYTIFLLRSMTKTFSVPGLRIGYGIGDANLIHKMHKYKEPWSLNTFALVSMPYFLDQKDQIDAVNAWSRRENVYMAEGLENIKGLKLIKGEANYHLIEIINMSGQVFFDRMIERGIYLRTCLDFDGLGEQFFRVALRQHEDNKWFLTQLSEVLNVGDTI